MGLFPKVLKVEVLWTSDPLRGTLTGLRHSTLGDLPPKAMLSPENTPIMKIPE